MATAFGDYKVPKSQYHCAYELHVSWMEAARSCPHPAAWPLDVVFNKRLNTVQEMPSSHSLSGPSRFIVRHMESNSRKSLNMTTFRGNYLPRNVLKSSRAIGNIIQPRGRSKMKQINKNKKMESRNSKNAAS